MPPDDNKNIASEISGDTFRIVHCDGAIESFENCLSKVGRKSARFKRAMAQQIERLANGHRLSSVNFVKEGPLPKLSGQSNTKHFYALKRIPIRGYCWRSDKHKNTYFISHYIYKDQNKLSKADVARVQHNWRRIEEDGDER